nr:chloride channel protein [uncultured Holophaga sp.]
MAGLRTRCYWTGWDVVLGSVVGILSGSASALFMFLLEGVIRLRKEHLWLLGLLPVFGVISAGLYRRWGQEAERGGTLIMDEVLHFEGRVPTRMAPLVLAGTLLSHLGGASVGREGTAVQMGASLARTVGKLPWRWLRLTRSRQRLLLMAGVSAGFGSLFGTPVAGAVFGMEAIAIGQLHYEGLVICAVASFVGDLVCRAWGIHHPVWHIAALPVTWSLGLRLLVFSLPIALAAGLFSELAQGFGRLFRRWMPHPYLRLAVGGMVVILLCLVFRTTAYLNLGTDWLPRAFEGSGPVPGWAFALKLLFTTVTLGFGFKGGEVTPLFVIGALLGVVCAPLLGLPQPFLAVVGYAAIFAAASNTPIASTLLGIEIFGAHFAVPLVITCFLAYVLVGHRGIYGGHRVATPK